MKKLFIECRYDFDIKVLENEIVKLPKKIALVTTIQYVDKLKDVEKILKEHSIKANVPNGKQIYPGQILGCDAKFNIPAIKDIDAFLYIGDGKFHPTRLSFTYDKDVFILNPFDGKISKIKHEIVEKYKKQKKGAMLKFMTSNIVGVLFTQKPGQKKAFNILRKIKEKYPDKNYYIFYANEINLNSLENFPFIDAWINTACPRIEEDFKCINIDDVI